MLSQRLKLFTIASRIDTTELTRGRNMAEPLLSYVFRAQRSAKAYMDADPVDPGFYENVYFNSSETLDSLADFRLTNMLKLEFKTTFRRKVQLSMLFLFPMGYSS